MTTLERDTGGRAEKHPKEDRCFFCVSDDEVEDALFNHPHPTIHWQRSEEQCPYAVAVTR